MYNTINDIRTVHSFSRIEFLQKIDMRISFPAYHPSVTDDFVINKAILFYFFLRTGGLLCHIREICEREKTSRNFYSSKIVRKLGGIFT